MSTFKKSAIALALATAFAPMLASAQANGVTAAFAGPGGAVYARNVFGNNANQFVASHDLVISASNAAAILGRTTGFNIRITLNSPGAAVFHAVPMAPTVGSGLPDSNTADSWTITLAGGGAGQNTVTYAVNPPDTGTGYGIVEGDLITLPAADIVFRGLAGLATNGATLTGTVLIQDPVGGGTLATVPVTFIVSQEGVSVVCNENDGNTTHKIDVAINTVDGTPDVPGKRVFSPDGSVGGGDDNSGHGLFERTTMVLGSVNLATAGRTGGYGWNADGDLTNSTTNDNTGTLRFADDADTFTFTVTGTNLSAFNEAANDQIFISNNADCSAGTIRRLTVNGANTAATGTWTLGQLLGSVNDNTIAAASSTVYLCAETDYDAEIAAQSLSATVSVNLINANLSDPVGPFACEILDLEYNGSVVKIMQLPPAGNAQVEGQLRIVNDNEVGGLVTIESWDDTGAPGATATLNLAAGQSVTYRTAELETGTTDAGKPALSNGIGDGAGRWRLRVTGEFDNMNVQAFAKNRETGTLSNITDFANHNEQVNDSKND